jgi:hypothetical protein
VADEETPGNRDCTTLLAASACGDGEIAGCRIHGVAAPRRRPNCFWNSRKNIWEMLRHRIALPLSGRDQEPRRGTALANQATTNPNPFIGMR